MSKIYSFDDDSFGSVLQFFALFSKNDHSMQDQWIRQNEKKDSHYSFSSTNNDMVWMEAGPSKNSLMHILETGRSKKEVRLKLDKVFRVFEEKGLIDLCTDDDNINTSYRQISHLGLKVYSEGSHLEYLNGPIAIANLWKNSIIKIYNPSGPGIGTGFLINETCIATARHVVEDLPKIAIESFGGASIPYTEILIPEDHREEMDVALIHLAAPISNVSPFRFSGEYHLLQDVIVFGYPPIPQTREAHIVISKGEIGSIVKSYGGLDIIVVSCILRGGNSGGAVVDTFGDVIGLVSRSLCNKMVNSDGTDISQLGYAAALPIHYLVSLINNEIPSKTLIK